MITEFLSEESIALHKEYVRQKRLKYSIIESYLPAIKGAMVSDIPRLGLSKRDRTDVLELLPEIALHEIYFASFSDTRYVRSEAVSRTFGSEAAYLNRLFSLAKNSDRGFLTVGRGGVASVVTNLTDAFINGYPVLAVDLCEHAYFLDYGFDKERYLVSCLSYLDLTKITS